MEESQFDERKLQLTFFSFAERLQVKRKAKTRK